MTTAEHGPSDLDDARARRAHRDEAWHRLRAAIAHDLIGRLPEQVPLELVPGLLRVPCVEVSHAISSGAIVVAVIDEVACMVTAESTEFLASGAGARLPLSEHLAPRAHPSLTAHPLSS